jgi:hypothetical protein
MFIGRKPLRYESMANNRYVVKFPENSGLGDWLAIIGYSKTKIMESTEPVSTWIKFTMCFDKDNKNDVSSYFSNQNNHFPQLRVVCLDPCLNPVYDMTLNNVFFYDVKPLDDCDHLSEFVAAISYDTHINNTPDDVQYKL